MMAIVTTIEETPSSCHTNTETQPSTTTPDESTPSSTASPEASDEATIIVHQESVPVIMNSILRVTNDHCNKNTLWLSTLTTPPVNLYSSISYLSTKVTSSNKQT